MVIPLKPITNFSLPNCCRTIAHVFEKKNDFEVDADLNSSIKFLTGTFSNEPNGNEIIYTEFTSNEVEEDSIISKSNQFVQGELLDLATAPSLPDSFVVRYRSLDSGLNKFVHLKIEEDYENLTVLGDSDLDNSVLSICLNPIDNAMICCLVNNNDLEDESYMKQSTKIENLSSIFRTSSSKILKNNPINFMRFSPHKNASILGLTCHSSLQLLDLRSMKLSHNICTPLTLRSFDFNPNRDNFVAVGSDDGYLRLFDLRKTNISYSSVKTLTKLSFVKSYQDTKEKVNEFQIPEFTTPSHSHLIWSVEYHPFRDELILTSSGDNTVKLFALPSYASENNLLETTNIETGEKFTDGLVAELNQHADCVYSSKWSLGDPWCIGSVSHDGNLILSSVPEGLKMAILLGDTIIEDEDEADSISPN